MLFFKMCLNKFIVTIVQQLIFLEHYFSLVLQKSIVFNKMLMDLKAYLRTGTVKGTYVNMYIFYKIIWF